MSMAAIGFVNSDTTNNHSVPRCPCCQHVSILVTAQVPLLQTKTGQWRLLTNIDPDKIARAVSCRDCGWSGQWDDLV